MQDASVESFLHQLGILEKILGSREDAVSLCISVLNREIAEARAFIPMNLTVATDDPLYRVEAANTAEFLSYLTDPIAFLASRNVPTTFTGLIVIGRYQKLPMSVYARISGVPGTHIAFATVNSMVTGQSLPNDLVCEQVLLDYVSGTDRMFFHQQIIDVTKKQLTPNGVNWDPDSLQITRAQAAKFASEAILGPAKYVRDVPVTHNGLREKRYYRILEKTSTNPPLPKSELRENIDFGATNIPDPTISRGFVIELSDNDSLMCAVVECKNAHPNPNDLPGNGVDQVMTVEQMTIKCY